MLKRQRPVTPPPSSLDDPPAFLPSGPARLLHSVDPSQLRSKRQRIRPPPLDGALRGWPEPESTGVCEESDGEEDWIEDVCDVTGPSLPPSATADQYKDTNLLLHQLHVLSQHRLSFVHAPSDQRLDTTRYTHVQDPAVGERPVSWTDGSTSSYHAALSQAAYDRLENQGCYIQSTEEKGLVEEIQHVRRRYEDANRLLGSLFLSRRREVEGTASPLDLP